MRLNLILLIALTGCTIRDGGGLMSNKATRVDRMIFVPAGGEARVVDLREYGAR